MKKRIVTLVVAVMLLALAIAPAATAMTWGAYVKTANGKGLNLRTGPTTNASIIRSIPYGAYVGFIEVLNDTWVQVNYDGYEGYVMRRYLSYEQPGPKPTQKPSGGGGSTSDIAHLFDGFQYTSYQVAVRPSAPGGFVHMRWAPTKSAGIIEDLHQNDQLQVLSQNNTWAQVHNPQSGATGFMMRSFLTNVGVGDGAVIGDGAGES